MAKHIDKLVFLCKAITHTDEKECLIWPYSRSKQGYAFYHHIRVYVVVCAAAHGDRPSPRSLVAHGCGNGHQGCINPHHLRWAFPKENSADAIVHGRMRRGMECWNAKLNDDIVRAIRAASPDNGLTAVANHFGVSLHQVCQIRGRRRWKHVE